MPTRIVAPSTVRRTPRPAVASKPSAATVSMPRSRGVPDDRLGQRVLAAALGGRREPQQLVLGDPGGRADERSPRLGRAVIVPVLSRTTAVTRCASSSAAPSRMRMPVSAPLPVPTMIAVGVARPMAHGQAMIRTAIAVDSANGRLG